jgi:hypothetical protein
MITPFGTGVLFGVPVGGVLAPNPTPWRFGVLQDAQLSIKGKNVKLRGRSQHAVKVRRGEIDVDVKAKIASLDPNMLNQLFLGCPQTPGITLISDSELQTAGGAAPAARANSTVYAVGALMSSGGFIYKCAGVEAGGESAAALPALQTVVGSESADGGVVWQCLGAVANSVSVANAATFLVDYGVNYFVGGGPLQCSGLVAPQQGQYQVSNGLYVFNAADAASQMKISYTYSVPNRGTTVTINDQPQGSAPEFKALLYDLDNNNKYFAVELNDCIASEFSIPTKQGAFWISDIAFDACVDSNDILGHLYADNY